MSARTEAGGARVRPVWTLAPLAAVLVLVGSLMVSDGRAGGVDHDNPGPVLMAGPWLWGPAGDAWVLHAEPFPAWSRAAPSYDLPVPAASVRMIEGPATLRLVTEAGAVWVRKSGGPWAEALPWPGSGGPVALDSQSWGQVKAAHR